MIKGKILFVDTTHPILKEELQSDGFICDDFTGNTKSELIEIVDDYMGLIIRSKLKIDHEIMDQASQLQFIGRVGSGMENIDVEYAGSKNIACLHCPEGNRDAVGEQAIGMLLALFNKLNKADKEVRKGIWLREENRGIELGGKTIGIIGYGNTGSAFARKLAGFNVEVLAYDKYKFALADDFVAEADMPVIFERCDILSLHVPLTKETTYLVESDFISRFKKNIYLVNTSRGKVVKTKDLVENLRSGKISGACLDVLEYEELSFENLEIDAFPEDFRNLVGMQNVVLSPHIAGWTHESKYKMAMVLVEKIRAL